MKHPLNRLLSLTLLSASMFAPAAIAATFTVNSIADDSIAHDSNPGDGICLDGGAKCTLRAAIEETNALLAPGSDTILFGLSGTITLAASEGALPTISDQLVIDGTSAPGYPGISPNLEAAPPSITISGISVGGSAGSASGLRFSSSASSASSVNAIGVVNFGTGINFVNNSTGNSVASCYLGVLSNGAAASNGNGIYVGTNDNVIGRIFGSFGNVISANVSNGILIGVGSNNIVSGNRIGTTPNGISARGNGTGIAVVATGANRIGLFDNTVNYGNLVSGNLTNGISMFGSDANISANVVGINKDGSPLGNGGTGIRVQGSNNTIGSAATNGANTVANNVDGIVIVSGDTNTVAGNQIGTITFSQGNSVDGIRIDAGSGNSVLDNFVYNNGRDGISTLGNSTTIQRNRVGWELFAIGGVQNFGNGRDGISLQSTDNTTSHNSVGFSGDDGIAVTKSGNYLYVNLIGVTSAGGNVGNLGDGIAIEGTVATNSNRAYSNTIAFNYFAGVYLSETVGNANSIYRNSIYSNIQPGIDLRGDGPTDNDPGDADIGPNKLQNFPEIVSVSFDAAASPPQLTVTWRMDSTIANSTYTIAADFYLAASATTRQGKTYVVTSLASTPTIPNMITVNLPMGTIGGNLVATATDSGGTGSTSEFSPVTPFGISDTIFRNGFDSP